MFPYLSKGGRFAAVFVLAVAVLCAAFGFIDNGSPAHDGAPNFKLAAVFTALSLIVAVVDNWHHKPKKPRINAVIWPLLLVFWPYLSVALLLYVVVAFAAGLWLAGLMHRSQLPDAVDYEHLGHE